MSRHVIRLELEGDPAEVTLMADELREMAGTFNLRLRKLQVNAAEEG